MRVIQMHMAYEDLVGFCFFLILELLLGTDVSN